MKRRTFLHLSSAALAALGLSACGAKTMVASSAPSHSPSDTNADVITDDIDADYVQVGLTLEEAKASSDKVFILRNGTFYSLSKPLYCHSSLSKGEKVFGIIYDEDAYRGTVLVDSPESNNASLFDGDQLVYISSDSIPDSIEFAPITYRGYTLPLVFDGKPEHGTFQSISTITHPFFYYDSSYQAPEPYMEHTLLSTDDFQLNGLSLNDYAHSNSMVTINYRDYSAFGPDARCIVDLTDYVTLENNSFTLREKNDHNVVTISFYSGTDYHEITLEATCVFFTFDPGSAIACNIQKTKDGYAIVDTSPLSYSENYVVAYGPDCAPFSILSRES